VTFVVTLEDFVPLPREDGIAWSSVRIDEAPAHDGPWTVLETQSLPSPLDPDPQYPAPRSITTTLATLDVGGRATAATQPVQNTSEAPGGVRPYVRDVAALLRARTKVTGGGEAGTFNGNTRPTGEEVDDLIDEATDEVLGKVQTPTPGSSYERRVRGAIRMYAAILIELSYWPEQVKNNHSPVSTYQSLYDSRLRALIAEGETGTPQGMGAGGSGGGSGDSPGDAAWTFPENTGGLVGWTSRW